ncbi:MAG: hypothetical protein Kow0025_04710 [Thermodesulfovibrionales bacterium]
MKKALTFTIIVVLALPFSALASQGPRVEISSPALLGVRQAVEAGRLAEARGMLSGREPRAEDLWQYHYLWAEAEEDPVKAAAHLRLAYLDCPEDGPKELLFLERGRAYLEQGYFHEAGAAFLSFLGAYPESPLIKEARLGAALSLKETGRLREAVRHFEGAGRSAEALWGKANALQALGWTGEAAKAYGEALISYKDYLASSEESLYRYAENLRSTGRAAEARGLLEKVADPKWKPRAEVSLGLLAMGEDDLDAALGYLRAAALEASERAVAREAHLHLARAALKAGRQDEARGSLEKIRLSYPYGDDYDKALLMLARLYAGEGRYADAVALLKEQIFRISPVKEALDEFEAIVLEVRKKDEALFVELWKSAGSWLLDASREEALLEIAEGLRDKGGPFLEISLWLSEHGSPGARSRGLEALTAFYTEMKDMEAARRCLETLRAMKAGADAIARAEARILHASGDARAAAERLMSLKELDAEDLRLLGASLREAADPERAAAFYKAALKGAQARAEDYVSLADFLYGLGRREEALRYYLMALEKDPAHEWALLRQAALSGPEAARGAYDALRRGGSVFGRYAGARLREMDLAAKLEGRP